MTSNFYHIFKNKGIKLLLLRKLLFYTFVVAEVRFLYYWNSNMGDIGGRPSLTLALQFLTEKSTTVYKFVKKQYVQMQKNVKYPTV